MNQSGSIVPGQKSWKEQNIEESRRNLIKSETMRAYREYVANIIELGKRFQNTDGDNTIS